MPCSGRGGAAAPPPLLPTLVWCGGVYIKIIPSTKMAGLESLFVTPQQFRVWCEAHPSSAAGLQAGYRRWKHKPYDITTWFREMKGVQQRILLVLDSNTVVATARSFVMLVPKLKETVCVIGSVWTSPTHRR